MTETSLRVERHYDAPPADVFEALTDPAKLKQWFAPSPEMKTTVTEVDLREGGAWKIVMEGERTFACYGLYKEISSNRLVFSWSTGDERAEESIVTIELTGSDGGTDLVLTHEQLAGADSTEQHEHGWNGCLDRLPEVL